MKLTKRHCTEKLIKSHTTNQPTKTPAARAKLRPATVKRQLPSTPYKSHTTTTAHTHTLAGAPSSPAITLTSRCFTGLEHRLILQEKRCIIFVHAKPGINAPAATTAESLTG